MKKLTISVPDEVADRAAATGNASKWFATAGLRRIGYSRQVPTRRAIERDPAAIATWHRRRWPSVRG